LSPPPLLGLRDNVRSLSWAHWKAHSGLPISINRTVDRQLYYRHVCIALYTCAYVILNSYLLTYLDRQTDGQTEFSSLDRVCIACSAVKIIQHRILIEAYFCALSSKSLVTKHSVRSINLLTHWRPHTVFSHNFNSSTFNDICRRMRSYFCTLFFKHTPPLAQASIWLQIWGPKSCRRSLCTGTQSLH